MNKADMNRATKRYEALLTNWGNNPGAVLACWVADQADLPDGLKGVLQGQIHEGNLPIVYLHSEGIGGVFIREFEAYRASMDSTATEKQFVAEMASNWDLWAALLSN